jgi:hypothetical protein
MSVVSLGNLPALYSPDSGNISHSTKFAGVTERSRDNTTTDTNGSQLTSISREPVARDFAIEERNRSAAQANSADTVDTNHAQSAFARALRENAVAGRSSPASANPGSQGNQSARGGTALYRLVSQMGNTNPSISTLLNSWNSVMQIGQDAEEAGARTPQRWLQSDAPSFAPGSVLHLTA